MQLTRMQLTRMQRLLINLIAFQIGWFACVIAGGYQLPWLGTAVAMAVVTLHLLLTPRAGLEWPLLAGAGLVGLVLDSLPVGLGWVDYASGTMIEGLAPHWIVAMWVQFATLLNVSLRWLRRFPWLAAVAGALFAPPAYYLGSGFGGMVFTPPVWQGLLALAVIWAIAMPLLLWLASRHDGWAGTDR